MLDGEFDDFIIAWEIEAVGEAPPSMIAPL
jgi:hypothetical protein